MLVIVGKLLFEFEWKRCERFGVPHSELEEEDCWKLHGECVCALSAPSCGGRNRRIEDLVKGIWIEVGEYDHQADGACGWV